MDTFLTLVISGAVTGALYSLVASGLVLSYTATGIFNFAYGGVAFAAAYIYYELNTAMHWPIWAAAVMVIFVFAPLLGIFLDVAVLRRLARAPDFAKIVASIGLLLAIPAFTEFIFDQVINIFNVDITRSSTVLGVGFPAGLAPVPEVTWHLPGKIPINSNELVVFCCAVICAVFLYVLLRRTTLGLRMRAVVDRPDLARMRGVNSNQTSRYAWIVGTVLAALVGVAGAPILGGINTTSFTELVFVSAAAAVLGRLRSIPYAFIGGLVLGVAEDLVTHYATFASNLSGFNSSVPVIILLIALVVLASGRGRRAGSTADEVPPPDYLAHLPKWRRALPWLLATVFLICYITILSNTFWAGVMAEGLALSLIFLSFVIVTGMGGMVSLAQAVFVTSAGLVTGFLFDHIGIGFYASAAVAIVVTVIIGVIVALPAVRLGGLFLALATLALAILCSNVLFKIDLFNNTQAGWTIPRLHIGPLTLTDNRTMAMVLLALVGIGMLLIRNLRVSSWGRAIAAVRSSQVAAATSGISATRVKVVLFALSAGFAAVGGIMYASFQGSVSTSTEPYTLGLLWLATTVLFGIRRPAAAAWAGIGAAVTPVLLDSGFHWWSWVPSWLSWNGTKDGEISLMLFASGAIVLARYPDGFLSQGARQRWERARKRAARRALIAEQQLALGGVPAVALAGAGGADLDVASLTPQLTAEDARLDDAHRAALAEQAEALATVQRHADALISSGAIHASAASPVDVHGLLEVRGLVVGYGDVEVLHGIDLAIPAGKITALFGANGGGKSTLCNTIAGLVTPTAGSITLEGEEISRIPPHLRVSKGMLVAPESRGIFPGLTVQENLELRLSTEDRQAAYDRFPRLGERRGQTAGSLSGGEQQMLALAPVLVRPPKLVVADEPTLGLAPLIISQVVELFAQLREAGTAILVVEEKVRDVLSVADRVAFIELGHIVWSGEREDLDDEQLTNIYLGAAL